MQPMEGKKLSPEDAKIAKSCKEFEAVLWRQMIERSMEPLLAQAPGGSDSTGTYNYFVSNTLSEAVSGGSASFSALRQSQLTSHSPKH